MNEAIFFFFFFRKKNSKWPTQKKLIFSKSPILKIFLWKFHGSVLGLVGLIDAKGIDLSQPIFELCLLWCLAQSQIWCTTLYTLNGKCTNQNIFSSHFAHIGSSKKKKIRESRPKISVRGNRASGDGIVLEQGVFSCSKIYYPISSCFSLKNPKKHTYWSSKYFRFFPSWQRFCDASYEAPLL